MRRHLSLPLTLLLALPACTGSTKAKSKDHEPRPPCTNCTPSGDLAFVLPSPEGATLFTATTMDKVLREAAPPIKTGDSIRISVAKNELEPFQIVIRPDAAAKASISITPFTGPGTINDTRIHRVDYVHITAPSDASSIKSPYVPDPLHPTAFGAEHSLLGAENQPFWITVRVPPGALAGDYTGALTVTVAGASV